MTKNKTFTFVVLLLSFFSVFAQRGVDAYFYYAPFYAPGTGTYVETYIAFAGNSLHYIKDTKRTFKASVEVTMLFKNAEGVKESRKYKVSSPSIPDTSKIFPTFIDLQRIIIPNGVYDFELIIEDSYAPDTTAKYNLQTEVTVNIPENEMAFSGIQFIERFSKTDKPSIFVKNGYKCIPYVSDFFPENIDNLRFYAELYNTSKKIEPIQYFLILFHIENYNTLKPIKEFSSFQKQKANNVNVILKDINIKKLPTGNYYLSIEVRNKENEVLLNKKQFFQRINNNEVELKKQSSYEDVNVASTFASEITGLDTLSVYLRSVKPISDNSELVFIENQLEARNLKFMQQFFYNFWHKRNEVNPSYEWELYRQKVSRVGELFGTRLKMGFETDMGRVQLQYGPPSSILSESTENGAYPYQIWHYYHIGEQTNRKFLFYNKNNADGSYELLHSNMLGEINNPSWEYEIYPQIKSGDSFKIGESKAYQSFEGK